MDKPEVLQKLMNAFKSSPQMQNVQIPMPSPVQQYSVNPTMNEYANSIAAGQIPYAQNLINQYGAEKVINGIQQGLNFGNNDIAQWQQQYNAGAGRENPIAFPTTPEQIAQAQNGLFNVSPSLEGGVAEPKPTGFLQGLRDIQSGFKENANNGFQVDNLKADPNKSNMFRVGEALGTAGRFAASPVGRGLMTAGIVGATGGNPLQMMSYGGSATMKNQQLKMSDQIYRQQLKQLGYTDEQLNNIMGYVDNATMKNVSEAVYKRTYNEIMKNFRQGDLKVKQQNADTNQNKAKTDAWYKGEQVKIGKQNAASNAKRADAYAKKGATSQEMNADLSEYLGAINSGADQNMLSYGRENFIKKYGKDPDKLLKSDSTERLIEALMSN